MKRKLFLFNFSSWKKIFLKPFLSEFKYIFYIRKHTSNQLETAIKKGLDENSVIYIWGRKEFIDVENWARENSVKIVRVEDGFIRSIGLGSDLTRPYSLVFDELGMYFDNRSECELERILNFHQFTNDEIEQAKELIGILKKTKISKYNSSKENKINIKTDKKIILVIGQVDDDASVQIGTDNMSNLVLLKAVKKECGNDACIVFRPHPDVLSGNRKGAIDNKTALEFCDEIVWNSSLADMIEIADEVHTMTSLSGFEALLRGKKVVCYGKPFWAGWGLSDDKCELLRRMRKLSIYELVAGVYILYPRYIHPNTLKPCSAVELVLEFQRQKENFSLWKQINTKIYSFITRNGQKLLKIWIKK